MQQDTILTHIRDHIAQQQPPLIRKETALTVYTLTQKCGLRTEALQAARCTLYFLSIDFDSLSKEEELGLMPGAFLHELWKYHNSIQSNLKPAMQEFAGSRPRWVEILGDTSGCRYRTIPGLPRWIDNYIVECIHYPPVPISFNFTKFYLKSVYHCAQQYTKRGDDRLSLRFDISNEALVTVQCHIKCGDGCSSCFNISDKALQAFWDALMTVVQGIIARAESDFMVGIEGTRSKNEVQTRLSREAPFLPKHSDMPGANIILQSSDLVNFQVHRWVLATYSPFFRDMFSLPQPSSDTPNQLPVVCVSETAEILDSLISMLCNYLLPEMPHSSDNILTLLAVTDKYDMGAIRSVIKESLSPSDSSRVFHMYAVACSKKLIPEMEAGAHLTLDYPMTFKSVGKAMRSFDGGQLRDLFDFRQRCLRKLSSGLETFLDHQNGPSKIWVGCPESPSSLPWWLRQNLHSYYEPFPTSVQVRKIFLNDLKSHIDVVEVGAGLTWEVRGCHFCYKVYTLKGEAYFAAMVDVVEQAWNVPVL